MVETFGLGEAMVYLAEGKLVARLGWNGRDMFVFMRPADELSVEMIVERVKSLPQAVKDYYNNLFKGDYKKASDGTDFTVKFGSYLCMKAADGSIVNGWLPSTTDLQALDYYLID